MRILNHSVHLIPLCLSGGLLIAGWILACILSGSLLTGCLYLLISVLWMVLALQTQASLPAVAGLLILCLRVPLFSENALQDLPLLSAMGLGLSAFGLRGLKNHPAMAVGSGILWSAMVITVPALWPLGLIGLACLVRQQEDGGPTVLVWAMLPWLVCVIASLLMSQPVKVVLRPHESLDPAGWADSLQLVFDQPRIWVAIALVALLDLIQRYPQDLRHSWKGLVLLGALFSLPLLPPEQGWSLVLGFGLPAAGWLLTRYALALPLRIYRAAFAGLMVALGSWVIWTGGLL